MQLKWFKMMQTIHPQWWSNRATHRPHMPQCLDLAGLKQKFNEEVPSLQIKVKSSKEHVYKEEQ